MQSTLAAGLAIPDVTTIKSVAMAETVCMAKTHQPGDTKQADERTYGHTATGSAYCMPVSPLAPAYAVSGNKQPRSLAVANHIGRALFGGNCCCLKALTLPAHQVALCLQPHFVSQGSVSPTAIVMPLRCLLSGM